MQRTIKLSIYLLCLFSISVPALAEQVGLVTWVLPEKDNPVKLKLYSTADTAEMKILQADDEGLHIKAKSQKPVRDINKMGWKYVKLDYPYCNHAFLEARDSGKPSTHPVKIIISHLYPGKQKVYLRYWSKARSTDGQWYVFRAALEGVNSKLKWFDWKTKNARVVAGLGGYNDTVYEVCLGTVGSDKKPATEVAVKISRYIWGKIARFAGLRIETEPNPNLALTDDKFLSPAEKKIKDTFLDSSIGNKVYHIKVISGMVKVRPKNFSSLIDMPLSDAVEISAANNEYENSQVVVFSPNKDLKDVTLEATELESSTGDVIGKENILFAPVGFVMEPKYYDIKLFGWWPETILTFMKKINIKKKDLQPLWYRVYVPENTSPGNYQGYVTIKPANAPATKIPVKVTVWDFKLPKMSHLRVVVSHSHIPDEFVASYKINPSHIYSSIPPKEEKIKLWAKLGVTAFNVGYIHGKQLDPNTKMPKKGQLAKWCKEIDWTLKTAEKYGIRDKAYLYMFDESNKEWFPAMKLISETFRKKFPDLLLLTTAHAPAYGEKDGIQIQGWCPLITNSYNYKSTQQARKAGKQIWWYVCITPPKPFANLFFSEPAIDHRLLLGFMSFDYAVDGFLYYQIGRNCEKTRIKSGPYLTDWPIVDSGDGQLVQIGPKGEPLPTIRLENVRDGLEDYDYLFIARQRVKMLKKQNVSSLELKEMIKKLSPLFKPGNVIVKNLKQYTQNPNLLDKYRSLLARFIQQANKRLGDRL